MSNQNPTRVAAGNGANSGRFAPSAQAEDISVHLESAAEPAPTKPLRFVLGAMTDGGSASVTLPDGANCEIKYHEYPALGDNGLPVPGDVCGEFTVQVGGSYVSSVEVSPHGTSGYGNPRAKSYSAEQVEDSIAKLALRHPARTAALR